MDQSRKRLWSILAISMAVSLVGPGISPALSAISDYFPDASSISIQMITSLPSLLMVLVAIVFSGISNRFSMRGICVIGGILYTVGGVAGYFSNSIEFLIVTRIIIGLGSGLLMPMSVGLLSYFYDKQDQKRLNGYIVILTSISSIVSMVLVGALADLSWRACFLVYLYGVPCIIANWKYIPTTILHSPENKITPNLVYRIWPYALGIFSIFVIYYAMLNNCSAIMTVEGQIDTAYIGVVMAVQTVASLFAGIIMEPLYKFFRGATKYAIWGGALASMLAFCVPNSLISILVGQILLGVSLAMVVGLFNSMACIICHKDQSLSVSSFMSMCRCFGQFIAPILLTGIQQLLCIGNMRFPYILAAGLAAVMLVIFIPIRLPEAK